jgi:hypothetical protein
MTALRFTFVPTAHRAARTGEQSRVSEILRDALAIAVLALLAVACIALRVYVFVPIF